MAHQIETMAYTNEVPWHGLGHHVADAPSVPKMLKLAKLDWHVDKQPLYTTAANEKKDKLEVEDYYALVRDKDHAVLDVVGRQYKPVQNKDSFEFFKEFVEAGKAKMETAGSLRGGRYVWGLANLNHSFKLAGNDEVKGYILVVSPHEQGKSLIIKFTSVRVVCNNTLTLALKEGGREFRMAHRVEFDSKMRDKAKEVLGIAHTQMEDFEKNAQRLKKLKVTKKDAIKALAITYQPDVHLKNLLEDFDKNANPTMKRLMDILENAPGADPTTGWGVLNAVTYHVDHVASRTTDKRITNSWLGKGEARKLLTLDTLLRMTA